MTGPALEAQGLVQRFGTRLVLDGVSLAIAPGEVVAVLGPSGAGKTTLLRCLALLTRPESGRVLVGGTELTHLTGQTLARARRPIGIVFQQFNLVRRLTALENVLAARLADAPAWRVLARQFSDDDLVACADALAAVGLADQVHQRADTLSGGQQQRVAIARAVAQETRVLLADEPVASLDPESAAQVLDLIKRLARQRGIAVLCALHQPALAHRVADRVLRLDAGRLSAVVAAEASGPA